MFDDAQGDGLERSNAPIGLQTVTCHQIADTASVRGSRAACRYLDVVRHGLGVHRAQGFSEERDGALTVLRQTLQALNTIKISGLQISIYFTFSIFKVRGRGQRKCRSRENVSICLDEAT